MNCWICGDVADSREHKIKKSLITALHGRGPYIGAHKILHGKDGRTTQVQGPDSKHIKYGAVLCGRCNNERTQPHDRAYERFTRYWIDHERRLIDSGEINFRYIFGNDTEKKVGHLYRYFAKHLGCDICDNSLPVPPDLGALFFDPSAKSKLKISFAADPVPMAGLLGRKKLSGIGPLVTTPANHRAHNDLHYIWSSYFSSLRICLWYDCVPTASLGEAWFGESTTALLGEVTSSNFPYEPSHIEVA